MANAEILNRAEALQEEVRRRRCNLITLGVQNTEAYLAGDLKGEPTCQPNFIEASSALAEAEASYDTYIAWRIERASIDPSKDLHWKGGRLVSSFVLNPSMYDNPLIYSNGLPVID